MVKKSGYNVYQGTHPIMVLPWFLYDCELLDNPYDYGGSSKLLEVRPRGNALEARALPTGFVTSVLSDLDVTDDEAIVAFCRTFGMVACPYARGFERMARRIESPMSDAEFYSARKFMSRDETDLRKPESGPMNWVRNRVLTMQNPGADMYIRTDWRGFDPVSAGSDQWEHELAMDPRDRLVSTSFCLGLFRDRTTALGTDIANAFLAYKKTGDRENMALVSLEEVRTMLALLQLGVVLLGGLQLYNDNLVRVYQNLIAKSDGLKKSYEVLFNCPESSYVRNGIPTVRQDELLHMAELVNVERDMRRLYDSVVPLFDACIRKFAPVGPFVQTPELLGGKHARRWGSFDGWLSAPDVPDHGSLMTAISAQVCAYLADGNAWHVCERCGRIFKYKANAITSPITSENGAEKEYALAHREARTVYCCKRDEVAAKRARIAKKKEHDEHIEEIRRHNEQHDQARRGTWGE